MKIALKKSFAVILALVMCVSVLFGMNLTIFAADSNVVNYVYNGSYVYNWGQRETEATFLSPMAIAFYEENNISLNELLALNGSSTESSIPSSTLYKALQSLMKDNHDYVTNYDATKNLFKYTDCQNSGGKISSFYSGTAIGPEWNSSEWNREHVWPNSKGDKAGSGENDLMMLRPTSTSENSSRGNKAYGTTTSASYYNPNDEGDGAYDLRGDCARIILYQYVRWECTNTGSGYNPNSIFGANGVIESKKVLLDWIEADPVDTWELGRNDAAESILGTRNIFVDYPELAFDLLDVEIPKHQTPSGYANGNGTNDDIVIEDDNTNNETNNDENITAPESATYTFTNYTAGTQYANETLILDDVVTATSYNQNCHFTSELRMYNSNTTKSGGMVILSSKAEISKISLNAGYKATTLAIYSSADGSTWSNPTSLSLTTSYKDLSVDLPSGTKYIKIENSGSAQARIKTITLNFVASSNEEEPTIPTNTFTAISNDDACGTVTTNGNVVTVTPADGYKLSETEPYLVEGGEATVTDNGNGTYTISNVVGDVTISFNFEAIGNDDQGGSSGGTTTEETVTISFATTAQRVSQNGDAQIWSNNDLTFTNNKAASSNAVVSNVNPIRVYANSSVTVEHATGKIKSITFAASGSSYVTPLQNSVNTISGATVTTSGNNVTATFSNPAEICTISKVTAQFRLTSVTATVLIPSGGSGVTITAQSNNTSYGSVELSGNYIIATPNEGYEVVGYEVVSGTATVTQNGNNFTVEADADVTVQINFAPRTQYTVTFKEQGNTTSTQTAYSGDQITLPSITAGDYTVAGWVTATIDGETTEKPTFYTVGSKYTVTANTTLHALYSRTAAGGGGESNVFTKYTGAITEGDYLIVSDGYAMQAGVSSNRFTQSSVGTADSIDNPAAALIWTVTADGSYYTLYNESTGKYAAGTGTKNQGKLATTVDDYARWTVSGTATYEIVNKGNSAKSINANIRRNGNYGFATYATSTGKALTLYKRTAAALTTYYFTGASETPNYTVTANANDDTFGTVTVSGTTISATPNEGYTVAGYSIASGTATVVREGNTFFVTPTSNVEITINFEALPTYTVTFIENGEEVDSESTYSGGFIKLPEYSGELDEYTTFDGWAEQENETDSAKIYAAKATYAVTKNVTLYAQFTVTAPPVVESDHYFVKVTEDLTDWTGTYLIVYEEGNVAFDGSLSSLDVVSNGKAIEITDGKIAATSSNLAITFTVTKNADGTYTIRSKSGFNIGGKQSDANGMLTNANSVYKNSISIDADGNAVIVCTYNDFNNYMRYNATSGQDRFRYFKASSYNSQKPIALYKLDVADISGAQVTVGADLSMNYYVDITNIAGIDDGELAMRFTLANGGAPTTIALDKSKTIVKDSKTYYVFTFAGVAPQQMCDNIRAELLLNGTVVDSLGEYSVKQNAANLLGDSPSAELKQFVTDLLYYGAAAQTYTKYNTDNLATSGDIAALLGTPSDIEPSEDDKMTLTTSSDAPANSPYFRAASVWFDSTNKIIIKLAGVTSDTKLYLDDNLVEINYDSTTDTYSFTTIALEATRFDEIFIFDIYEGDEFVQSLEYSINAYAYSKYQNSNNPNMAQLALALYRVGKSADAYAAKP